MDRYHTERVCISKDSPDEEGINDLRDSFHRAAAAGWEFTHAITGAGPEGLIEVLHHFRKSAPSGRDAEGKWDVEQIEV